MTRISTISMSDRSMMMMAVLMMAIAGMIGKSSGNEDQIER